MDQNEVKSFMKSVITVFRLREGGFEWTGECGRWRVLAWSTKNLASLRIQSEGKLDDYRSQLRKEMPDGVIVAVDSVLDREIRITAVDERNGPQRLICVDVGGTIKDFEISHKLSYEPGDLFIVPVDGPSSYVLQRLREDLRWLAPDQERSVFHLIGQPSLESRMGKMEAEINEMKSGGGRTPGGARTRIQLPAEREQSGWTSHIARYENWIYAGTVLLLILILGLLWFFWYKPRHSASMIQTPAAHAIVGPQSESLSSFVPL